MELSQDKHLYPEAVAEVAGVEVTTEEVAEVTMGAEVHLKLEVQPSTLPQVNQTTAHSGRTTTEVWA